MVIAFSITSQRNTNALKLNPNVNINENETNLGTYTASGSSVDTIKYSIGQYQQYTFHQLVSIDSSTGALTANEPFDYDSGGTGGYLTIYAESTVDPSIKNSLNVQILINNVDDVPPIFNEGMVGCDISGYSTSSSCSIATGEFAITSGSLSNPDGDDEESSIEVGGTDADLIYI